MANFHAGSSTEPLVDADVVNGAQIKTVEYQRHVLGGVELPWAEHGERVISRCSKQFVDGMILRNPQSVQEVRLNHHNPSITEPSVLPPCARWAMGNRRLSKDEPIITNTVPTGSEGMKVAESCKFAVLRVLEAVPFKQSIEKHAPDVQNCADREYSPRYPQFTTEFLAPCGPKSEERKLQRCVGWTLRLYVAGGLNNGNPRATTTVNESFSVSTHKWTTQLAMPTAAVWQASAVGNGQLYCIGGQASFQGAVVAKVQIYQP